MVYYPWPTNVTGIMSLLSYVSFTTHGLLGATILIVVLAVSFLSLKIYPAHKAFAAASIMTFITATFFRILGLINNVVLIISIILMAVGIFWMWMEESPG